MVSSQDGYCSVIAFEPGELGTPFEDDGTLEFPLPKFAAAAAAADAPPSTSASLTAPDASGAAVAAGTGTGAPPPLPWSAAAAAVKSDSASMGGVVAPQVGDKRTAESMTAETREAGGSIGGGEPSAAGVSEGGGEPQPKKVKKRVAPTLVKPLS